VSGRTSKGGILASAKDFLGTILALKAQGPKGALPLKAIIFCF